MSHPNDPSVLMKAFQTFYGLLMDGSHVPSTSCPPLSQFSMHLSHACSITPCSSSLPPSLADLVIHLTTTYTQELFTRSQFYLPDYKFCLPDHSFTYMITDFTYLITNFTY
jgi:hypothetical protein